MTQVQLSGDECWRGDAELHLERIPRTIELKKTEHNRVVLTYVDQRQLPYDLVCETVDSWADVIDAITTLAVRGAPALGVAGAAAFTLWVCNECCFSDRAAVLAEAKRVACAIAQARPTAVNLSWGTKKVFDAFQELQGKSETCIKEACYELVKQLEAEDEQCNRSIGSFGAALLPQEEEGIAILTHCNAGSLATVFYGTALGVVYAAAEKGTIARVYADETRPVGQGARLTAWELAQAGIPVTLICDNMAASLMASGEIDAVVVGADRIAANGDTANKIGTLGVAVAAQTFGVPFYVAAPTSTLDLSLASGCDIPIEKRDASEVLDPLYPGVDIYNPAFDVTPARFISAIITEKGVFSPDDIAQALSIA